MQHHLNMHEAKTHLSRYIGDLKEDDVIILCKRNEPVAEIRPISKVVSGTRPIGLGKGSLRIDESFFEPLPEDIQSLFEGKA